MPGTNQTSSENLRFRLSDILHFSSSPGKRQLESNRACPEIWVKNVQDDDEAEVEEEEATQEVLASPDNGPEQARAQLATFIAQWIYDLQINGFPPNVQSQYLKDDIDTETEDETDFDW